MKKAEVRQYMWIVGVVIVCVFLTYIWAQLAGGERQRLRKLPPEYENIDKLLSDLQNDQISLNLAVQVLIVYLKEREGVYLPFEETDTYFDLYYIDKANHEKLRSDKSKRYKRRK